MKKLTATIEKNNTFQVIRITPNNQVPRPQGKRSRKKRFETLQPDLFTLTLEEVRDLLPKVDQIQE